MWQLDTTTLKQKIPLGKLRPRDRPRKQIVIENNKWENLGGKIRENLCKLEKVVILMTEANSKINKSKLYDEIINDSIYGRH